MSLQNISFAGSGRVASSLCKKISVSGFKIDLIVSPSEENGRMLAEECKSVWSSELKFPQSTDLIIVAVPDHRLNNVLDNIRCSPETLIVHTAGSMGIDIFPDRFFHKGVFYPLQTFSNEKKVDFTDLPFLLETSDMNSSALLEVLVVGLMENKNVGGLG